MASRLTRTLLRAILLILSLALIIWSTQWTEQSRWFAGGTEEIRVGQAAEQLRRERNQAAPQRSSVDNRDEQQEEKEQARDEANEAAQDEEAKEETTEEAREEGHPPHAPSAGKAEQMPLQNDESVVKADMKQAHPEHLPTNGNAQRRFAWVTMVFPLTRMHWGGNLWRLYALAASIRKYSKYPLVAITDVSALSKELQDEMREEMGLQLYPMVHIQMPQRIRATILQPHWADAWSKLQVFNMTMWDRLAWVDSDGIFTRSMDHLFNLQGTWAQTDDGDRCRYPPPKLCSGLLLATPSAAVFKGLMAYAEEVSWMPHADQELIEKYFSTRLRDPIRLLDRTQAVFGHCAPPDGPLPGFIHKPDGMNECLKALVLPRDAMIREMQAMGRYEKCTQTSQGILWRTTLCNVKLSKDNILAHFCTGVDESADRHADSPQPLSARHAENPLQLAARHADSSQQLAIPPPSKEHRGGGGTRRSGGTKFAWVTLFPLLSTVRARGNLWRAFALASSVRKYSRYPLVIITDLMGLNSTVRVQLREIGVQFYPWKPIPMPEKIKDTIEQPHFEMAWHKLQMFSMTTWDRLVWLDWDGILTRNMDHLFTLEGVWAQTDDDAVCFLPLGRMCAGLVVFTPSKRTFRDLLAFGDEATYLPQAEQNLIDEYFRKIGKPVQLLDRDQAAFGHCAPESQVPGYLHKPQGFNECLKALASQPEEMIADLRPGHQYEECSHSKQGRLWRAALCEAPVRDDIFFTSFCSEAAIETP